MSKAFIDTSVIIRILVKDDPSKIQPSIDLIENTRQQGMSLYLLPVAILEIVWVMEKIYKYGRKEIRELVEAILNTPGIKAENEQVFRNALLAYETKNIKFGDAVMGYWGLTKGYTTVYTYDEKDFKRIEGLIVKMP